MNANMQSLTLVDTNKKYDLQSDTSEIAVTLKKNVGGRNGYITQCLKNVALMASENSAQDGRSAELALIIT